LPFPSPEISRRRSHLELSTCDIGEGQDEFFLISRKHEVRESRAVESISVDDVDEKWPKPLLRILSGISHGPMGAIELSWEFGEGNVV